jgi:DNA polymerase-3 subunit alpha
MGALFTDHLDPALVKEVVFDNTMEVFNKIEDYDCFANPQMHMPDPKVPEGFSFETYLKHLSYEGAKWRFDGVISEACEHRLEHELKIMNDSGFASYFIVVWDFINWAREQKIPVGPGRGSAAGSLVAYCLGITNIDPLKYDLLFERFLNPERKSMPDIDTDFCIERREEVIEYVRQKYGQESVCQIITFNRLTSRSVIKDMGRVLEYPYSRAENLAKMIPVVRGKPRTIKWMLENHDDFKKAYTHEPDTKEVIDLAVKNEGLNKTFGVHAAGVIIADKPITDVIPTSRNNDGSVITQFAMEESANMGLLKMDFLGLRNLTMIQKALDIINETRTEELIADEIPFDDPDTLATICSGNLSGIFQLETSAGMRDIAKRLAPKSLEDISALIALYRPGPLDTGMIDDFIDRKSGKQKISYDHPLLEEILGNTYGTIVYQEQIMQIAQVLAGFSLGEADLLRRAMGKKKPEVLLPFKDKFIDGCLANQQQVPQEVGEKLFDQMIAFAEYCFNKSHSTAYGFVTYQTAFLKTHYPVEYLTSLFISCSGDTDRIKGYIIESQRIGIEVQAPHINKSTLKFRALVKEKAIVFGLSAVKGVGAPPSAEIIREREENGPYKDFMDFCTRIDHKLVNKRTVEGLIRCGALDGLGAGRKAMIENLEAFVHHAKKAREKIATGQMSLFAQAGAKTTFEFKPTYLNGKTDEYPERELQAMEYELLGLFVSSHPMQSISKLCNIIAKSNLAQVKAMNDKSKIKVPVLITSFVKKITKSKKIICIMELEDQLERIEGVIFAKKLPELEPMIEKGKRVLIKGTLSKNSEGTCSIMVDTMDDLDHAEILEFTVDVSKVKDHFSFFHALKATISQETYKGDSLVVLKLNDGSDKKCTELSLGQNFTVNPLTGVRETIDELLKRYAA